MLRPHQSEISRNLETDLEAFSARTPEELDTTRVVIHTSRTGQKRRQLRESKYTYDELRLTNGSKNFGFSKLLRPSLPKSTNRRRRSESSPSPCRIVMILDERRCSVELRILETEEKNSPKLEIAKCSDTEIVRLRHLIRNSIPRAFSTGFRHNRAESIVQIAAVPRPSASASA